MGQVTRTQFGCVHRITFGNDQILAFPSISPITIVSAIPGAIILPESIALYFDWAADLTNVDDDTEIVQLGYSSAYGLINQVACNGMFDQGRSVISGAGAFGGGVLGVLGTTTIDPSGMSGDLQVFFSNGSAGDFEDGAAGNRLIVEVYYDVFRP